MVARKALAKITTKQRLGVLTAVLVTAVLAVWVVFYLAMSNYLYDNAERQTAGAANQIVARLGEAFARAERQMYTLAQSESAILYIRETEQTARFTAVEQARQVLTDSGFDNGFAGNVILFNGEGQYARLTGKLGNMACAKLYQLVQSRTLPAHLSLTLDGRQYIGYAVAIGNPDGENGAAVMLIEEETLTTMLDMYSTDNLLHIAIFANGEKIVANTGDFPAIPYNDTQFVRSQMGITPFDIVAVSDEAALQSSMRYFNYAAVLTAAAFGIMLLQFLRSLNRRFLKPMVAVTDSIEALDLDVTPGELPLSESDEFDRLVQKINDLLKRLDRKSRDAQRTELLLATAEIERQKQLVLSLKKQINVHFIANTLSILLILIRENELEKAEMVATGLVHISRYAYDREEWINVWEELDILNRYIDIMNIRYGDKLTVEVESDDRLMDNNMPRMLLQPILENTIIHAFPYKETDCRVQIGAILQDGMIRISITDNGCGISEAELAALAQEMANPQNTAGDALEHIALVNIHKRLVSYYGDAFEFSIKNRAQGGTVVSLALPAR